MSRTGFAAAQIFYQADYSGGCNMLGAIAGDMVGMPFERSPTKTKDIAIFARGACFTDDTVMTVAVADALMCGPPYPLVDKLKEWYARHPHVGYGKTFAKWAAHPNDRIPYNSWGNGSAMRVSPVAWAFDNLEDVVRVAGETAAVTHDHPEGIAGAQAVAGAIYLARTGAGKERIRAFVVGYYGKRMDRTLEAIRPGYQFDVSCIGSVPEAIIAFLESTSFEDALRNAISLGGDSDTQACIAGAIAEGHYGGVPEWIKRRDAASFG
jgi:ADP-ribosylglycohydrolase